MASIGVDASRMALSCSTVFVYLYSLMASSNKIGVPGINTTNQEPIFFFFLVQYAPIVKPESVKRSISKIL